MFSDAEISVFMDELEEKIQCLNDNFLVLEREGGSQEALQEIFRAAHTIKGSSAVMGYEKMAALTHEMENLFDQLRKGFLPVSGTLIDNLFAALDTLQLLRDEIVGKNVNADIRQVVAGLRHCQEQAGGPPAAGCPGNEPGRDAEPSVGLAAGEEAGIAGMLDENDEEVIREAELRSFQAYWAEVELDPGCQMKSVRAFLVFETLQQHGEVIKSDPPAEDVQEGRFERGFKVILLTREDPGKIRNLLMTISEVDKVELERIDLCDNTVSGESARLVPAGGVDAAETTEPDESAVAAGPAAPAETRSGPNRPEQNEVKISQTVRVDVQKLDTLMNLVGELVIDRTRLNRFAEIFEERYGSRSGDLVDTLNEISNHLGQVSGDLQEQIMKARMLPVAQVFNRFPRMVRDLSQKLGKEIDFIVEGHETELDRNVIEVIGDPLIHLIRNAVDHGIEQPRERLERGKPQTGTLRLRASYMENHIIITIQDDGRGINPDQLRAKAVERGLLDRDTADRMGDRDVLNLIFSPGFSTASEVSDLSGRGVGMDIVRSHIEQINGIVEVNSTLGAGTLFTIKLPLTLAIIRALMVGLAGEQFAFPLTNVVETISVSLPDIKKVKHSEVIVVRGQILPLLRLSRIFERQEMEGADYHFVVILGIGEKKFGVIVDELIGELEIVIKSLGDYLGKVPFLSGATILGDGQVALIVDVRSLVKEIGAEESLHVAC